MVGGKFYLKKVNGKCVFLCYDKDGKSKCRIYDEKPHACIAYPFYVYNEPKNEDRMAAEFRFNGLKFYVYVDALCPGFYVADGIPVTRVIEETIKLLNLNLGLKCFCYSTVA